ncbi:regulator of ribonuclease activity A [Pseudoxanthomonas sp. GM95]|uniref:ribonuclease E activity regulator RraA n=1 Tax=Pseudoxanthomonas sp. GM95 TaxID=1881043 RepID=UPI0008D2261B|nr:ribonuclease E activity regulator RraA [Pseudoxanthomonas sp. GM95]SEK66390.1 regulator of ribonuclease activity A [Pseudoxanthomonas sp. GM95]
MQTKWTTPDLCDAFPEVGVAEPLFRDFGGKLAFSGQIVTIRCMEDNSRVREQVEGEGTGKVLVVDGGGSLRHALLGDMLAEKAVANGWAGVLIHGGVRDVEVLGNLPLGIKALAATPMKTDKRGLGDVDVPVRFAGVSFVPGHWLYADANGVIVAEAELILPA